MKGPIPDPRNPTPLGRAIREKREAAIANAEKMQAIRKHFGTPETEIRYSRLISEHNAEFAEIERQMG